MEFYLNFKLKACKLQACLTTPPPPQKKQENKSWHKLYTKSLCIGCLYLTSAWFSPSLNLIWKMFQINLTLTTEIYIFKNYLIISYQNDKTLQLIHVKCTLKWCNRNKLTFGDFSQRKIMRTIIFSSGFLWTKNQVLRVLIGCNIQLLSIKIYAGISNIFKKVHHLLKLRASNKGIKQMLFFLFLNFLMVIKCLLWLKTSLKK